MTDSETGRILILTTPFRPNVGGVETHLDDLIALGLARGFKFTVLTYQPLVTKTSGPIIEKGRGLTICRLPWLRMNLFLRLEKSPVLEFMYLFPGLFVLCFMYLLIYRTSVKILHAQGLVAASAAVILGKIFGISVLVSTHSIYNFPAGSLYSKFVRLIFENTRNILALSKQSRREILGLGIAPRKVHVFTYWVDHDIFRPAGRGASRVRLHLPKKAFICLFVGRLVEVKGVKQLLDAIPMSDSQVKYLVVGDGPMAIDVENATRTRINLIFRGRIANKLLPEYYNASDVLVVPSVHEEGFGRVILEALSCGLPVVASNRGGIKEALSPEAGVLIDVSPREISRTVDALCADRRRLNRMRCKALLYAKANFNSKNADLIFKYYE